MRVFILHQLGRKASLLQKRFRMENIHADAFSSEGVKDVLPEILLRKMMEFNACILYAESPEKIPSGELIAKIARKNDIPILVLDEYENPETEKMVLKYGAHLYLSAPFSFPDIAMKLKFLVYRNKVLDGEKMLRFSDLKLDFVNHMVRRKKRRVFLRNREFALLEFMLLNSGKVLTRNTILEHVWDRNGSLLSNTVDVHMARLRRKVDGFSKRKLIHTVYCVGYKLDSRP